MIQDNTWVKRQKTKDKTKEKDWNEAAEKKHLLERENDFCYIILWIQISEQQLKTIENHSSVSIIIDVYFCWWNPECHVLKCSFMLLDITFFKKIKFFKKKRKKFNFKQKKTPLIIRWQWNWWKIVKSMKSVYLIIHWCTLWLFGALGNWETTRQLKSWLCSVDWQPVNQHSHPHPTSSIQHPASSIQHPTFWSWLFVPHQTHSKK